MTSAQALTPREAFDAALQSDPALALALAWIPAETQPLAAAMWQAGYVTGGLAVFSGSLAKRRETWKTHDETHH